LCTVRQQALQERCRGTVRCKLTPFPAELSSVAFYLERLCEAHCEHYGRCCPPTLVVHVDDDGDDERFMQL